MTLFNEYERSYTAVVGMEMLNGGNLMKPSGYQALVMETAERHLRQFSLGVDDLLEKGMSWVLVSSSVAIAQPIRGEITVVGHTWHSEQDRLTFRRELRFTDTEGHPLFDAVTFSVLMNLADRRILRPDKLDFRIGEPHAAFVMDASPKLRVREEMQPCDRRRVYPSCIDRLGHTNNCRYAEFAYDALTEGEIASLDRLRRFDVVFRSELKPGESFTVRRSTPEVSFDLPSDLRDTSGGELFIDGIHDDTGKQSFVCRMLFA